MSCPFNIKTKSGNNSILFKEIVEITPNINEAIDMYYLTKTEAFKDIYGDWENGKVDQSKLDVNGEPLYSSLSADKFTYDQLYNKVELDSKAITYKKLAALQPKIETSINDKIQALKSRDNPAHAETIKNLEALKLSMQEKDIEHSVPSFLESAKMHILTLESITMKELKADKPDIQKLSGLYKASQTYRILTEIQAQLLEEPALAEILTGEGFDITKTIGRIHNIEEMYISQSKKFLADEFSKRDSSWSKADVRAWLDASPRDVAFTEQMLEYIGDSADKVLAAVGNVVMEAEHKHRRESIEFNEELREVLEKLEKKYPGKKAEELFSKLIYVNDKGETHLLNLAVEDSKGLIPAHDVMYNKVQEIARDPELFEFYQFFYNKYTQLQNSLPADSRLGTRLPMVTKAGWERMEGVSMKDRYNLMTDDMKKKIARSNLDMERGMLVDSTGKPVKRIPIFYAQQYDSVDFNKYYAEKFKELTAKGEAIDVAKTVAREHAITEATKHSQKVISHDLAYSLQMFHSMATNYSAKNEIINILDSASAVVGSDSRHYYLRDSGGKQITDKNGDIQYKTGKTSTATKVLEQFLDTKVYGMEQKDLGEIDTIAGKIDTNKSLRAINNATSLIQLAGNVFAAIPNIGNGEYNNVMEAIGGEYYKIKNYKKAAKIYRKNLSGIMGDVGSRTPRNFVNLLNEKYNILQDYQTKGTILATEKSLGKRLFDTNLLFFMNNSGEHFMQVKTGMSVMDAVTAYTKDGKESGTLLDAHSEVKGRLVIKDGTYVKGLDGNLVKYDEAQQDRIANKMNAVTRKLYGNYSGLTANAMKQDARLALFTKFRDWAYEGIVRRYGKMQKYQNLEQEAEGFYRTGFRVGKTMIKDLSNLQVDMAKAHWSELTVHEKANIRRALTEAAMVTLLGVSGALLAWGGKHIEDEYDGDNYSDRLALGSYRMLVYETNRLYSELFSYINPVEALRIMTNPVASMSIAENLTKLTIQIITNPFEEYTTGWRKGENKVGVRSEKLIPLYKQLKVLNPDGIKDKGVFYNI